MPEVDVMTQQEDEEKFAHVLLLLIAIQCFVTCNYKLLIKYHIHFTSRFFLHIESPPKTALFG